MVTTGSSSYTGTAAIYFVAGLSEQYKKFKIIPALGPSLGVAPSGTCNYNIDLDEGTVVQNLVVNTEYKFEDILNSNANATKITVRLANG